MSGGVIPTSLKKGQRFLGIGPLPTFILLLLNGWPQNCHRASGCVTKRANILQ